MKQRRAWRFRCVSLVVALAATLLIGCSGGETTAVPADAGDGELVYTSTNLDTRYPNALDASGQLALGALRREETGDAVTPEKAATLLPLWQAIQGGTLQGSAELNAILAQIEAGMTQEQLDAIAAMRLTRTTCGPGQRPKGFPREGAAKARPRMAPRAIRVAGEVDRAQRR